MSEKVPKPQFADVLAGLSVALVLVPQSLAYAQIAGMPPVTGLFASALPLIVCAPFASSPYLQTGPVALTSLLTLAALQGAGFRADDPDYVAMAGLLAVLVGAFRLALGVARAGWVAYLVIQPVLMGFASAAAVVILSSQLPKALGNSLQVPGTSTLGDALWSITHPDTWHLPALVASLVTLVLMLGGRRIHRLFPGVALAVAFGLAFSAVGPDPGPVVGQAGGIPEGLPSLTLDLPWGSVGTLAGGALIIALVGFAEPASIARIFAKEDRTFWNANAELISQGVANVAAGISGAFPVGGSFSRSSVNRLAGARTKWSGGVTGILVLAFLPFAGVLDSLPQAILGAVVVGAVLGLLNIRGMLAVWAGSPVDAILAWVTWITTLWLAPNVQWAILIGLAATAVIQILRPLGVNRATRGAGPSGDEVHLQVQGLLWLGSHRRFERQMYQLADEHRGRNLLVDLGPSATVDPPLEELLGRLRMHCDAQGGGLRTTERVGAGQPGWLAD